MSAVLARVKAEPVRIAGLISGVAIFLAVRYGHVQADLAAQLAALAVPWVLAELARMHVVPVVKAGDVTDAQAQIAALEQDVATLKELGIGGGQLGQVLTALQTALADGAGVLQDGFDRSLAAHAETVRALTAPAPIEAAPVVGAPVVDSGPPRPTVTLPTAGSRFEQAATPTTTGGEEAPAPPGQVSAPSDHPASAPPPNSRTAPPTLKG